MRSYLLLIFLFGFEACGDNNTEKTVGFTNGQNPNYFGSWYRTFFAQYDSSECAGDNYMGGGVDTTKSVFYTLFEDGTILTTDGFVCKTPDNVNDSLCRGTWTSTETSIIISSGGISLIYKVTETSGTLKMSKEFKGYSDIDEENPMCQLYEYTQLEKK